MQISMGMLWTWQPEGASACQLPLHSLFFCTLQMDLHVVELATGEGLRMCASFPQLDHSA